MNSWDKLKAVSAAVAAVFIPIVLVFVGQEHSQAIKEREVQSRFAELSSVKNVWIEKINRSKEMVERKNRR